MNIWFTADTHFGHNAAIKHSRRPFSSLEEMNETIIDNWNFLVKNGDIIYHLGDFGFGRIEEMIKFRARLKGKVHLIYGNHDFRNKINRIAYMFSSADCLRTINWDKNKIILCHYSMNTWDSSHYDSWHLFGHSHGTWEGTGKSMDVGVDCFGYAPVNYDIIKNIMINRPHNANFVGNHVRIDTICTVEEQINEPS